METRHRVQITPACRKTFRPWSDPSFLQAGVPLEQVSRHGVVFTDASATGWGATYNGHAVSGVWTGPQLHWYINCLELLAVRLALSCLRGCLQRKDVLVRTDNTATVAYINRQGGLLLPSHVATRPPPPPLESEASEVPSCHPHPRSVQSGSRRAVSSSTSRRVETPSPGKAVSKQRMAHWIVDAITLAYEAQGVPCPLRLRAHSTRGVASSWALARGASLADIYSKQTPVKCVLNIKYMISSVFLASIKQATNNQN